MSRRDLTTTRGYDLSEVASALQKAIRRNDPRIAGYFAIELHESGFEAYAWRRLLTISAEDCAGLVTQEVQALYQSAAITKGRRSSSSRVFLAKAVLLLCLHPKSRDADHLPTLVYDQQRVSEEALMAALADARAEHVPIPDYALDVHTARGRARGKTQHDFFVEEFEALSPRVPGLFDDDVAAQKGRA